MSASPNPSDPPRGAPPRALTRLPLVGPLFASLRQEDPADNPFALAALERHKKQGMALALRARFIAMVIIAATLPFINAQWSVIWYEFLVLGFIGIGLLQQRVARVGQSRAEILLIWADVILMTITLLVPNPLGDEARPLAMQYRAGGFVFFFILLAFATLAYSWRTVWGLGVMASDAWLAGYAYIEFFGYEDPALGDAANSVFTSLGGEVFWVDPNSAMGFVRVQEVVAFLIVAAVLATTVRRFSRLVLGHAAVERERANLARYFSPNVVDQLSHSDEPLKEVRTQNVAVLFVDIVGFTAYAANRPSAEVIETLRAFHGRMEREVFAHGGTLDKYLGDGLMATFGTPFAGDHDATNALTCARAMMVSVEEWNRKREAAGEPPLRASFGLHFGPAVLGDIGANRLEFAVIGNTVNVASRVEALTRSLDADLVATAELKAQVEKEDPDCARLTGDMAVRSGQSIRGLDRQMDVWTLRGERTLH